MNILFVTHYAGFYGANQSLYTLILLLREHYGVMPSVLLPTQGEMCDKLKDAGIPYQVSHYYWWVNENHGVFQKVLNWRKQYRNKRKIDALCSLYDSTRLDVIYSNSICVNIGYLMAKQMKLPHIWQARESLHLFNLSLPRRIFRKILSSPSNNRFILPSKYMMTDYRSMMPIERMTCIYNGVSLPKTVLRGNQNRVEHVVRIACVGVLCPQKNQLELLRAQVILQKRGIIIETNFIGVGKEDYLATMRAFISSNHIEEFVHIIGHKDDVFSQLQSMNLGVVCARDEAFGRVTIEYMLMNMPVVVTNSGANAELVVPNETGDIYELGNPEQLADKIEQYVRNPELLSIRGDRAKVIAENKFSARNNADNVYRELLKVVNPS